MAFSKVVCIRDVHVKDNISIKNMAKGEINYYLPKGTKGVLAQDSENGMVVVLESPLPAYIAQGSELIEVKIQRMDINARSLSDSDWAYVGN